MRIYIITMDDPIQTYDFIKYIIDAKEDEIVGVAVSSGNRLTLSKGKSKVLYVISLLLIMGPLHFLISSFKTLVFKIRKKLFSWSIGRNPSILAYAESKNIPVRIIKTPNSQKFRDYLESLNIDIIINQSQNIIKKELLEIPKIGVLNRHNALLPKNRGRLTPFWVLFKGEKETGVSIHFVEVGIDSGDIIVQKKYKISSKDNFNSLVKRNYEIAPIAMIEAIDKLEKGDRNFIENNDLLATYNTTPDFSEALIFRSLIVKRFFKRLF